MVRIIAADFQPAQSRAPSTCSTTATETINFCHAQTWVDSSCWAFHLDTGIVSIDSIGYGARHRVLGMRA
jgi:hypothetical protein